MIMKKDKEKMLYFQIVKQHNHNRIFAKATRNKNELKQQFSKDLQAKNITDSRAQSGDRNVNNVPETQESLQKKHR